MKTRTAIILAALAACMMCSTAQASTVGLGDPFSFYFDENGNGMIDNRDGTGLHPVTGIASGDPNTGMVALTYLLTGNVGVGIVAVLDSSGAVSDAISFYNIGSLGFMAYYSTLPGTDRADTISGGFVPTSGVSVTEVGNSFAFFAGGSAGVNNDYYGISSASSVSSVPDGGSTLALLGGVFAGAAAFQRKLRK
jgi:hypothetical protein